MGSFICLWILCVVVCLFLSVILCVSIGWVFRFCVVWVFVCASSYDVVRCVFVCLCAFHTKNIQFSENCHAAVSGSKFTNDPSKCSQEIGFLPYHHNLLVMFVIFEKNWRLWKNPGKTAFFMVGLWTLAKFSIYLLISPLKPKKKFQLNPCHAALSGGG